MSKSSESLTHSHTPLLLMEGTKKSLDHVLDLVALLAAKVEEQDKKIKRLEILVDSWKML